MRVFCLLHLCFVFVRAVFVFRCCWLFCCVCVHARHLCTCGQGLVYSTFNINPSSQVLKWRFMQMLYNIPTYRKWRLARPSPRCCDQVSTVGLMWPKREKLTLCFRIRGAKKASEWTQKHKTKLKTVYSCTFFAAASLGAFFYGDMFALPVDNL